MKKTGPWLKVPLVQLRADPWRLSRIVWRGVKYFSAPVRRIFSTSQSWNTILGNGALGPSLFDVVHFLPDFRMGMRCLNFLRGSRVLAPLSCHYLGHLARSRFSF